jgi:predicted Zn-dependent protease
MRTSLIGIVLCIAWTACFSQEQNPGRRPGLGAYPEAEATAAWRALAAGYVRKALKEEKLNSDPLLNARVDAVMAGIGATVAVLDPRFRNATWKAILIEEFGHGAVAFPGETILVDAKFVRTLQLTDDELALILSHEVAHVVAGHAFEKLSFMADTVGRDKAPTARSALLEFLARDAYSEAFQPVARLQEREADTVGAGILFASEYDVGRALRLFDKLIALDGRWALDTHDSAATRKKAVTAVLEELRRTR